LDGGKLISSGTISVLASVADSRFLYPVNPVLTSDETSLFVPQHGTAWMSIVNLVNQGGAINPAIKGGFPTGADPSHAVFSPDGKYLFVVSFEGTDSTWPAICKSERQG